MSLVTTQVPFLVVGLGRVVLKTTAAPLLYAMVLIPCGRRLSQYGPSRCDTRASLIPTWPKNPAEGSLRRHIVTPAKSEPAASGFHAAGLARKLKVQTACRLQLHHGIRCPLSGLLPHAWAMTRTAARSGLRHEQTAPVFRQFASPARCALDCGGLSSATWTAETHVLKPSCGTRLKAVQQLRRRMFDRIISAEIAPRHQPVRGSVVSHWTYVLDVAAQIETAFRITFDDIADPDRGRSMRKLAWQKEMSGQGAHSRGDQRRYWHQRFLGANGSHESAHIDPPVATLTVFVDQDHRSRPSKTVAKCAFGVRQRSPAPSSGWVGAAISFILETVRRHTRSRSHRPQVPQWFQVRTRCAARSTQSINNLSNRPEHWRGNRGY